MQFTKPLKNVRGRRKCGLTVQQIWQYVDGPFFSLRKILKMQLWRRSEERMPFPILIRNDMTNFVYFCKPTQHWLWCISLDPESNFSFLILTALNITNQFLSNFMVHQNWQFIFGQNEFQIIKFIQSSMHWIEDFTLRSHPWSK